MSGQRGGEAPSVAFFKVPRLYLPRLAHKRNRTMPMALALLSLVNWRDAGEVPEARCCFEQVMAKVDRLEGRHVPESEWPLWRDALRKDPDVEAVRDGRGRAVGWRLFPATPWRYKAGEDGSPLPHQHRDGSEAPFYDRELPDFAAVPQAWLDHIGRLSGAAMADFLWLLSCRKGSPRAVGAPLLVDAGSAEALGAGPERLRQSMREIEAASLAVTVSKGAEGTVMVLGPKALRGGHDEEVMCIKAGLVSPRSEFRGGRPEFRYGAYLGTLGSDTSILGLKNVLKKIEKRARRAGAGCSFPCYGRLWPRVDLSVWDGAQRDLFLRMCEACGEDLDADGARTLAELEARHSLWARVVNEAAEVWHMVPAYTAGAQAEALGDGSLAIVRFSRYSERQALSEPRLLGAIAEACHRLGVATLSVMGQERDIEALRERLAEPVAAPEEAVEEAPEEAPVKDPAGAAAPAVETATAPERVYATPEEAWEAMLRQARANDPGLWWMLKDGALSWECVEGVVAVDGDEMLPEWGPALLGLCRAFLGADAVIVDGRLFGEPGPAWRSPAPTVAPDRVPAAAVPNQWTYLLSVRASQSRSEASERVDAVCRAHKVENAAQRAVLRPLEPVFTTGPVVGALLRLPAAPPSPRRHGPSCPRRWRGRRTACSGASTPLHTPMGRGPPSLRAATHTTE